MTHFAVTSVLLLVTVTISIAAAGIPRSKDDCICDRMLDPVCGSDGQTYGNLCMLNCESKNFEPGTLTVVSHTSCEELHNKEDLALDPVCVCSPIWIPVCGSDGKTYGNACELKCESKNLPDGILTIKSETSCEELVNNEGPQLDDDCICNRMYDPVCGSDGKTYGNLCMLNCERTSLEPGSLFPVSHTTCEEFYKEERPQPCVCHSIAEFPVCGSNGKTYKSMCELECESQQKNNKLELFHFGEC